MPTEQCYRCPCLLDTYFGQLCPKCKERAEEEEREAAEQDVLAACRRSEQRCHECPNTLCCDNMNTEAAEKAEEAGGV